MIKEDVDLLFDQVCFAYLGATRGGLRLVYDYEDVDGNKVHNATKSFFYSDAHVATEWTHQCVDMLSELEDGKANMQKKNVR